MSSVCHPCTFVFHPYFTCMSSYVIHMSLAFTRMSSVYYSHVVVCHPYVTCMYPYVILMSLVCSRISSICHSYVVLAWTLGKEVFAAATFKGLWDVSIQKDKSIRPRVFLRKGIVIKTCWKFTGKQINRTSACVFSR